MGFGAHHDPRLAVSRALTEMNQFMPAVLDVGEDGVTRYQIHDAATIHWWRTATLDSQPYLRALRTAPATRFDGARPADEPSAAWFQRAVDTLQAKGHEVLVLDQTRPDIGLPVAKVVVPGLRHFWARFAPGRLYDVPMQLGWLDTALTEEQLNPTPMFL
jgi:ribosomal protein S12 methylthiotransferase accessory factor